MLIAILAVIGFITITCGIVGAVIDVLTFDQTKGGYEYPYEGWTGNPVDWDRLDITETGLVKRGYSLDVFVHGESGMISFGFLGMKFDWQTFSERALKVHQPREALIRKGFEPKF